MNRYKMTLAYDGSAFCGWQRQKNNLSIQEHLETCLATILRHPVLISASGRTDAKVHALGQVAHFDTEDSLDMKYVLKALNGLSHPNIWIKDLEAVETHFHARYSASSKTYHYHVWTQAFPSPFLKWYRYHHKGPLDLKKLNQALELFKGYKDFTSFSNAPHMGACKKNPFRDLFHLECHPQEGGFRLEFQANGFLYKMVRNITGTLIEIARGKIPVEAIPDIFEAKDRKAAAKAAPGHALFLVAVNYE